MYRMVLHIPGNAAQEVNLPDGTFYVGSDSSNQFQLHTVGVSHRHCRFRVHEGVLRVMDLGSSNGTTVNGETLGKAILHSGSQIILGGQVVLLFIDEPVAAAGQDDAADRPQILARLHEGGAHGRVDFL